DFYRELEPDRIAEHLTAIAQAQIRDVVEEIMLREDPQLWTDLPPQVQEIVFARVEQQLPSVVQSLTDKIGDNIDQLIDAWRMVVRYLTENPTQLNSIFRDIGRRELRFMQNFGFCFGLPRGLVLFGVLHFWPDWFGVEAP